MPGRVVDRSSALQEISTGIHKIFDQAQGNTHTHQKNIIALHKVHTQAVDLSGPHVHDQVGEKAFIDEFRFMLCKVMEVKKGITPADRIVSFVGGYITHLNDKELLSPVEDEDSDEALLNTDTPASRFTENVVQYLMNNGCEAKDKTVRYRAVQLCAEIVAGLGEIDDTLCDDLQGILLKRTTDKETSVRVQAGIALCKLARTEDAEDGKLLQRMMNSMTHDHSAEVRRAILMNIPITKVSLCAILERTKDTDTSIRKLVYSHVLTRDAAGGVTHPQKFSIAQREMICRNGLGDRDESVRAAATDLLTLWLDVLSDVKSEEQSNEVDRLVELLKIFDLAEAKVANDALSNIFTQHPGTFQGIKIDGSFWDALTTEKLFLAQVFVQHCKDSKNLKDQARKDDALPEVTALAFKIQDAYHRLFTLIRDEEVGDNHALDDEEREDERDACEVTLEEMLKLAVNVDYQDEMGRRKMHTLITGLLKEEGLPEKHVARCLDVLATISSSEGDLIRRVVEIIQDIQDIQDPPTEDEGASWLTEYFLQVGLESDIVNRTPRMDMTPAGRERHDAMTRTCLILLQGCLERVQKPLEKNSSLDGVINSLVQPCFGRRELFFREKGIICLGLIGCISKRIAKSSIPLFRDNLETSSEEEKIVMLQALFDQLMVYKHEIILDRDLNGVETYARYFSDLLDKYRKGPPRIQALICTGLAKLMLSGIVVSHLVLQDLVMAYFSPYTTDNQPLRQCLGYFMPFFCRLRQDNQALMQSIVVQALANLCEVDYDKDNDDDMVSCNNIGEMFLEWTNPETFARALSGSEFTFQLSSDSEKVELFRSRRNDADKRILLQTLHKVICQLLPKLYLPDVVDDDKVKELKVKIDTIQARRPPRETTAKKALAKFADKLAKKYEEQLKNFDEDDWLKMTRNQVILDEVDAIFPHDDDDEDPVEKKSRKR
ncbi:hypothetical protein L218DRAFT_1029797 [Marasmius fiardii PR-910]|nr:hypothetical protein L218DRAFT_1029797 [Marasmius fiardii PR-910]